jgi:PAS domain S-box-containing protein
MANGRRGSELGTGEPVKEFLSQLVPIGIMRTDASGHCTHVNEHWCHLAGLSTDEALEEAWSQTVHPDDRDRVLGEWETATSRAVEFRSDCRWQAPSGKVRWVATHALPVFDGDGRLEGYVGAVQDVTDQRRAEEELRRLAHDLGERVKELNCLFGISRIVEDAGGSLDRIFMQTVNLLPPSWEYPDITCARITLNDSEFRTPNFRDTPWKQSATILVHGEQAGAVEIGYLEERPEGDEGPFLAEERALVEAVAERLGHVVERILGEQRLKEREDELRKRLTHLTRVSTVGEMASSIAHEINQPLTAIATYTQACRRMLNARAADETHVQEILARVTEEALRAGQIVHRLRHLVRKRESVRAECDINQLIHEIEHLASADARLHDVELRLQLERDLPPILADGIQIQQVVLNLIRNGIDAMEETDAEPRQVRVRTTRRKGKEIEVSVHDNGCGLPENAEEELFEPFFTTKTTGMGLGLSISRSIVSLHGGSLWFERNAEGGTTFRFTVPLAAD